MCYFEYIQSEDLFNQPLQLKNKGLLIGMELIEDIQLLG